MHGRDEDLFQQPAQQERSLVYSLILSDTVYPMSSVALCSRSVKFLNFTVTVHGGHRSPCRLGIELNNLFTLKTSRSRTQTNMANDELEEINGIKPKVWLQDGEEREVSSQSRYFYHSRCRSKASLWLIFFLSFFLYYHSNSVYKVKRTFDHYYW